jgi:hypothetical protein
MATNTAQPTLEGSPSSSALPTIELKFPALYPWMLIVFGVIFFLLGLLLGHQNVPLGIFTSVISLGAIGGGHYWLHNRHVVARITPRLLVIRREGAIKWTEIAEIEKKTITVRNHGVRHPTNYVCIKLSPPRPVRAGVNGFLDKIKRTVLGGYDIVVGEDELSCGADWFIAECQKRMLATRQS